MAPDPMDEPRDDPPLGRLLRERLPRHPASPRLRAAVAQALAPAPAPARPRWGGWMPPALAALATAMALVVWMAGALPRGPGVDPIQPVARAVVSEHARSVLWGEAEPDVVGAALPRVMEESGIALSWVFTGDDELRLVGAHPTVIEGHRALALTYLDIDGHTVTYLIAPVGGPPLPRQGRVKIGRWEPLLRTENGWSLLLWRQQGLLCALVSDLVSEADLARFKEYFAKVRAATEPYGRS